MKTLFTFVFISILSFAAFGQTDKKSIDAVKPDFTGTWIVDPAQTKKADYDLTLIVVHRDPEMKVTKIFNFKGAKKTDEQIYYTDGRRIPDTVSDTQIASTEIRWSGGTLLRKYQVSKVPGKAVLQMNTEKWELSKDGQTLTLTLTETISATDSKSNAGTTQGIYNSADTVTKFKFKRGDK